MQFSYGVLSLVRMKTNSVHTKTNKHSLTVVHITGFSKIRCYLLQCYKYMKKKSFLLSRLKSHALCLNQITNFISWTGKIVFIYILWFPHNSCRNFQLLKKGGSLYCKLSLHSTWFRLPSVYAYCIRVK